jgi:hypothetical protein
MSFSQLIEARMIKNKRSQVSVRLMPKYSFNMPLVPDLSDTLLAWSGFGAATVASIRSFRSRGRLDEFNVTLAMVIIFHVAISLLNISMPALLSISTISINHQTTTLAQPIPGDFFSSSSLAATGDVNEVVASLQYTADYFDGTVGMVQGWNRTYA